MIESQDYILFYVNGKRILGLLFECINLSRNTDIRWWDIVATIMLKSKKDKNVDPEETLLYYLRLVYNLILYNFTNVLPRNWE